MDSKKKLRKKYIVELEMKNEVATNGVVTSKAMRLYCEHRISKTTFDKLVEYGIGKFKSQNSR